MNHRMMKNLDSSLDSLSLSLCNILQLILKVLNISVNCTHDKRTLYMMYSIQNGDKLIYNCLYTTALYSLFLNSRNTTESDVLNSNSFLVTIQKTQSYITLFFSQTKKKIHIGHKI